MAETSNPKMLTAEHASIAAVTFATLGVVYGDIGTSPLYAIRECFHHDYGLLPVPSDVLGVCSLVLWSLIIVVVVKYCTFVMRADNRGEGGILALLALLTPRYARSAPSSRQLPIIQILGLMGAALLIADGTITPVITVLGAAEGLEVVAPGLEKAVVPLTIAILIGIFLFQKRGTKKIARVFAPVMAVWFATIALMGIPSIIATPEILAAINPAHGISLLLRHWPGGFFVLGAVVLCITGAEALYADMGHFGRGPILRAWYVVVFPALILNYFGQGALILRGGAAAIENPFFALAPGWTIYPLVAIATAAAIIASQALISGSFSLTQQAVQLGFSPRVTVIHTSEDTKGQIYIPQINTFLMIVAIALTLHFRTSSKIAVAYGISVMGTMTITSILITVVGLRRWKWPLWKALPMLALFLAIDLPFLGANLPKALHGGLFPILVAGLGLAIMTTWKRGKAALQRRMQERFTAVDEFVDEVKRSKPHRIKGTAVFMTSNPRIAPPALTHHFKHNQVLHDQVLLLAILTDEVPRVMLKDCVEVKAIGEGIYEVVAHFGFMQTPTVEKILRLVRLEASLKIDEETTTYYLGREILLTNGPEKMARWRKILFVFMARNSVSATAYFGIPPDRVVELGMQLEL